MIYKTYLQNIPVLAVIRISLEELSHSNLRQTHISEFVCKLMLQIAVINTESSFNSV